MIVDLSKLIFVPQVNGRNNAILEELVAGRVNTACWAAIVGIPRIPSAVMDQVYDDFL